MRALDTGEAGRVGSVVVNPLLARGVSVVVLGDLSEGQPGAVEHGAHCSRGDIAFRYFNAAGTIEEPGGHHGHPEGYADGQAGFDLAESRAGG